MSALPDLSKGSITVIGDVMLDRFWSGREPACEPRGACASGQY